MRNFILFCLIFIHFNLFCQKNKFEIILAPFQPFKNSFSSNPSFKGHGGIEIGGHYIRQLNNKFSFVTGVEYNAFRFQNDNYYGLQWPTQHNGNGGFDANLTDIRKNEQIWIQIPLLLRFEFVNTKFKPFLQTGLIGSAVLFQKERALTSTLNSFNNETTLDPFKRKYIGIRFSSGLEIPLSFKKSLAISLFVSRNAQTPENRLKGYAIEDIIFNNLGIEIGYRF
jgi:hypothetical protein